GPSTYDERTTSATRPRIELMATHPLGDSVVELHVGHRTRSQHGAGVTDSFGVTHPSQVAAAHQVAGYADELPVGDLEGDVAHAAAHGTPGDVDHRLDVVHHGLVQADDVAHPRGEVDMVGRHSPEVAVQV